MKKLTTILLAIAGIQPTLGHAVSITTGINGGGLPYLTLHHDVEFTIGGYGIPLANPAHIGFVIREAITPNDGNRTDLTGSGLSYQISSESFARTVTNWRDNMAQEIGHTIRTDGHLYDSDESVNPFPQLNTGDTITLFAGTFTLDSTSPQFTLMNSGDYVMWISSNGGYRFSSNGVELATVPVPAAAWLFGSGLLGLAGLSRRKA